MHPLIRHRRVLLALLAAAVAGLGWFAARLDVDRTNDRMHSHSHPLAASYEKFLRTFGSDESIVVAVECPDVLAPAALDRLEALAHQLRGLPGVHSVESLTTETVPRPAGPLVAAEPLARQGGGWREREAINALIGANPWLEGRLISADRRVAAIIVELIPASGDGVRRDREARGVRAAAEAAAGEGFRVRVAGFPLTEIDIAEAIRRDQARLVPLMFGVFALLLVLMMRSLKGLLLPVAVVGATLAVTLGLYSLTGHLLNTVTSLLAPVVMVITVPIPIHLIKAHEELVNAGVEPLTALDQAVRALLTPCFLTTVTTVIGFLSLLMNTIPAVQELAVFAAVGVTVSLVASFVVVIPVLHAFPAVAVRSGARTSRLVAPLLALFSRAATGAPRLTLAVSALAALALSAGILRLRTDTNLLDILPPGAPVAEASRFIDERLTGVASLEVSVERLDGGPMDAPEDWKALRAVQEFLRGQPDVTHAFALTDPLEAIGKARGAADPFAPAAIRANTPILLGAAGERSLRFRSQDGRHARVSARTRFVGTVRGEALVNAVERFGRERLGTTHRVTPTGIQALVSFDSNALVRNQMSSLALAAVLILGLMAALFRSVLIGLVSAIPNVMPIAMVYGYMGFAGYRLSTATAMISSVMMGLVVDNTIHILSRYRLERTRLGLPPVEALRTTLAETGQPILVSTLVLIVGFGVGAFGSFPPTIDFSVLSGITMAFAVLCDLLVTPACLLAFRIGARGRGEESPERRATCPAISERG